MTFPKHKDIDYYFQTAKQKKSRLSGQPAIEIDNSYQLRNCQENKSSEKYVNSGNLNAALALMGADLHYKADVKQPETIRNTASYTII